MDKRKRDINNDNIESLKKLRKDNNIDSGSKNYNRINLNEINEFLNDGNEWTVKELKEYSKKISLDVSGVKKQDIYQNILNFVLNQKSIIDEQNEKENINSFNKQQPALEIKEGLERTEVLFWKIFRNKVLFHHIFSYFKFKELFCYDNLYSVERIIHGFSNGYEILKDKVKSNSYLYFAIEEWDFRKQYILILNNIIQENQENQIFYSNLFQNYLNYKTKSNLIYQCVESGNVEALKSINKNEAIDLKFVKLRIENLNSLNMLRYLDSIQKNLNYILQNIYNLYQDSSKLKDTLEIIEYLIGISSNGQYNSWFNEIKESIKTLTNDQLDSSIFQLIGQYSEIIEIDDSNNNSSSSNSNNNKQFSNSSIKEIIRKVVNLYYSIVPSSSQNAISLEHNLLFNGKNEIIKKILFLNERNKHSLGRSYDCSQIKCFFQFFKFKINSQFFTSLLKSIPKSDELSTLILEHIVKSGNLELLESFIKEYTIDFLKTKLKLVFQNLDSTQTKLLDYLFENYKEPLFNENLVKYNNFWFNFKSIKALEHYEALVESLGYKMDLATNNSILHSHYNDKDRQDITLKLINRIIFEKSNLYLIRIDFLDSYYYNIVKSLKCHINSQDYLISLYKSNYKFNFKYLDFDRSIKIYRFVDWYIKNNSAEASTIDRDIYIKFLYISGHYQELFNLDCGISKYESLMNGFDKREREFFNSLITTSFIDHLFKYINYKKSMSSFKIKEFLLTIIKIGNLHLLKHIGINYNYIFVRKSSSNSNGIPTDELKTVFYEAIKANYQISKLLSYYITLSETEIDGFITKERTENKYPWFKYIKIINNKCTLNK